MMLLVTAECSVGPAGNTVYTIHVTTNFEHVSTLLVVLKFQNLILPNHANYKFI
jgi:hypothetical protein